MATVTRPTTANAQRWAAALDRAISNALDVLVSTDGSAYVESASTPGLLYAVSRETCDCKAGQRGIPCQHRACYLAQIGELPLDPPPAMELVVENTDRVTILIGGQVFGHAAYWDDAGWTVFAGSFPHARKIGHFCTLAEIERDLPAMLPAPAPVIPFPQAPQIAA